MPEEIELPTRGEVDEAIARGGLGPEGYATRTTENIKAEEDALRRSGDDNAFLRRSEAMDAANKGTPPPPDSKAEYDKIQEENKVFRDSMKEVGKVFGIDIEIDINKSPEQQSPQVKEAFTKLAEKLTGSSEPKGQENFLIKEQNITKKKLKQREMFVKLRNSNFIGILYVH